MPGRRTKDMSLRVVLGIYAPDEGDPERAYRAIRQSGGKACLVRASGTEPRLTDFCARYARLRLDGEALVAAQTTAEKVQPVVQNLRAAGSPTIFVLPQEFGKGARETPPLEGDLVRRLRESERRFSAACSNLEEAFRLEHALT